jgi:hypothetical protein
MRISKKRLLLSAGGITTVGAIAALTLGATFGLFSATSPSQNPSFTAGTVTLTQPVDKACTITNIVPGDSNAAVSTCTFTTSYTGNVPAYLGLDVSIASAAANSVPPGYGYAAPTPLPLYDASAAGIQLTVSDGTTTYLNGTTVNAANLANNSGVTSLLVSTTPDPGGSTAHTFTVGYSMPLSSQNAYQGASATLTLVLHAVQSAHQGSVASCNAGRTCSGITWS